MIGSTKCKFAACNGVVLRSLDVFRHVWLLSALLLTGLRSWGCKPCDTALGNLALGAQWEVEPWGSWRVLARSAEYEAVVEATCAQEGTPLRAPTAETGLDVFCRDSFFGEVCSLLAFRCPACLLPSGMQRRPSGCCLFRLTLHGHLHLMRSGRPGRCTSAMCRGGACLRRFQLFGGVSQVRVRVWQRARDGVRQGAPLFDLTSTAGAVEVGGGPWWSTWKAQADMKEPLKSLVGLPVDVAGLAALLPQQLRPLGL